MKTDRRHELQTNVLADWIGKHLQQSQGYSKTVLAFILLAAAAAIAGSFLIKDQAARSQASWNQFFQAFGERDPEALGIVAAANQGSTASVWAYLAEADLKLAEGIGDLYTNRDNAKKNLQEAEKDYLAVDRSATEKLLRERAWFGLGQTYESLADIDKAKEYYGKLISSAPTSALGKEAQRRSDVLSDPSTAKWYNWFANQTPRPPAIPGMPDGLGVPDLPGDLSELSDRPDLSLPGLPTTSVDPVSVPPSTDPVAEPDLNSPASESDSADSETASPTPEKGTESAAEKPAAPVVGDTPAEPPAPESVPAASDSPVEPAASPAGEDASE
ncbi:MAG: hypothetical protein H6822_35765 [Planctomycetaceae bacterium]|nr:hypothetical protein [Planctomycetales bacterium]MCB9927547.1 hypothetical protein [Planctomycetaceae bacterium]